MSHSNGVHHRENFHMESYGTAPYYIVIGGQYGSEGKGEVVAYLASRLKSHMTNYCDDPSGNPPVSVVRIGGTQAGHNVTLYENGEKWFKLALQQLPCGFHLPDSPLYIGPGSEVKPEILLREIEAVEAAGFKVRHRIFIDPRATLLTDEHSGEEVREGFTARMGSTSKGVGACRAARIRRTADLVTASEELQPFIIKNGHRLAGKVAQDPDIFYSDHQLQHHPYGIPAVIETAQGYLLSLVNAGCYPYCTSTNIDPARALSDAGLSSHVFHRVVMVVRTYPIRVAGNSGPMGGSEISWEKLHQLSGGRAPRDGEKTTVTKKTRRVAEFDYDAFASALEIVAPDRLVLTFGDYLDHSVADCSDWGRVMASGEVANMVHSLESYGVKVNAIATGEGIFAENPNYPLL